MDQASGQVHEVPMTVRLGLVTLPAELLEKVIALVALSSVKSDGDGLAVLGSVCKTCRKAVLGWLTGTQAREVFQAGTILSPVMAGFFIHKTDG